MNPNLTDFKLIKPRAVEHLFHSLAGLPRGSPINPVPNKQGILTNCNTAVTLSERYSSPQGNLKRVAAMLKIEESC